MLIEIVTIHINQAKYLDEEEKKALFEELPELSDGDLEKLDQILLDTNAEQEILTEANDFAVAGLMQAFITLNKMEFEEIEKNK